MDIVRVDIAQAEHTHANQRGGRPEKRSSFHAEDFLPAHLFCQLKHGIWSSMCCASEWIGKSGVD